MDVRSIFHVARTGAQSSGKLRAGPCRLAAGLAVSLSLIGADAEASDQGSLAPMSKGSISISVSVAPRSQVTGLNDFTFSKRNLATSGQQSQSICVWSTTANRRYSIQAVGSGSGNAFTISNDRSTIRYTVAWNRPLGRDIVKALRPGESLTGLIAATSEADCPSKPNGNAILSIALESRNILLEAAQTGQTGSLQLLISPE